MFSFDTLDFVPIGPRILWIVNIEPAAGEHSGAGMRYLNFAKELARLSVPVFFAVNCWTAQSQDLLEQYLSDLKKQGLLQGFVILNYGYSTWQGRLGGLAFHPGLAGRVFQTRRNVAITQLTQFVAEHELNVGVISDRTVLFLGQALSKTIPMVFDWTDSMLLYYSRAFMMRMQRRQLGGMFGFLRDFQANVIDERYYGRRATLNAMVSPLDKSYLDRLTGRPERNRVLLNGTVFERRAKVQKAPKRLIFSGMMDYEPNYEAAIWFIREVLPLVLRNHPDAEFIVAGGNPAPQLKELAGPAVKVTGFVADLGEAIATSALFVSPLLSGAGFRNKVVEAIMNGTYAVCTPRSVEFLEPAYRSQFLVAATAKEFADAVIEFLDCPSRFDDRLESLQTAFSEEFSWKKRTGDLLEMLAEARRLSSAAANAPDGLSQ